MTKMTPSIHESRPALPTPDRGSPNRPAPPTQQVQPNGRSFITLLAAFRATGGTAPGEIMARLLNDRRAGQAADLATLIDTGQAFGFEWRSSLWVPMFQFDADDLALKAGAQEVRAALSSAYSGWSVAAWFAEPTVRLDDCSPADMLDADLGAVLRAARSQSAVDSCPPRRLCPPAGH